MVPHAGRRVGSVRTTKKALPAQKGGLKSAGTMPKSYSGRNAVERENRRFQQVFAFGLAVFLESLEVAVGDAGQRQFPARPVHESGR